MWTFFRSFPVIEQEKFGRPVKTAFFVSIKSFWKKLFWKTIEFSHHYQTLSWKFPASFRVFRRGCWNCILRVQGNILTKNSFFSIFFSFLDTEQFFWPILAKKVTELSKLDSQFQWILSGASLLQNLQFVFSWISGANISSGCPKKVSGAFKLLSTSPWEHFEETFFESFCIFCGLFFRSFPVIEQEKFGRPVKTAFFVSIKPFRKKNFWKTNEIFHHFQTLSRKNFGFFSSFSTGMLELHSTCPR